jgi:hypothetical protein
MSNILDNGTVLPFGLLSDNVNAMMEGFNKSYCNYPLRVGVVMASYPVSDSRNRSKLTTEYDVLIIEQNADKGATTILYRNCMSSEGMGSIADYFEKALRPQKKKTTKGYSTNLKGQDGAIVLLLCLDGMSDKGIIISALTHPDRKTNLVDQGPLLAGEYNGVNIKVNEDGSCSLTFKGATDNNGAVLDPSQGNTVMSIETNGSYQISHKNTTLRLDKSGVTSLTTTGDVNVTTSQGNVNVNVSKGDINVNAPSGNITVTVQQNAIIQCQGTATIEGSKIKLGKSAVESVIKGNTFKDIFNTHTHTGNLGFETTPPNQMMDPSLSKKVFTE